MWVKSTWEPLPGWWYQDHIYKVVSELVRQVTFSGAKPWNVWLDNVHFWSQNCTHKTAVNLFSSFSKYMYVHQISFKITFLHIIFLKLVQVWVSLLFKQKWFTLTMGKLMDINLSSTIPKNSNKLINQVSLSRTGFPPPGLCCLHSNFAVC